MPFFTVVAPFAVGVEAFSAGVEAPITFAVVGAVPGSIRASVLPVFSLIWLPTLEAVALEAKDSMLAFGWMMVTFGEADFEGADGCKSLESMLAVLERLEVDARAVLAGSTITAFSIHISWV